MLAQTVNDPIERLIWNGLSFITTALQDDRVECFLFELLEKNARQRRFAHSRTAMDVNYDRLPFAGCAKRIMQFSDLPFAANKRARAYRRRRRCRRTWNPQRPHDFPARRSGVRVPAQQTYAKIVKVARNIRINFPRLNWIARLLAQHHFKKFSAERKPASQRLIQNDADTIPIARFRDCRLGALLGRHVVRSPRQQRLAKLGVNVFDQTEIENHDAPLFSH